MTTAKKVVDTAAKYIGDDGTKFWKDYGLPRGSDWCCAFLWDIFRMSGAAKLFFSGKKTAYVPTIQKWLKVMCKPVKPKDSKAGDIVIFSWTNTPKLSRDHIGICYKAGTNSTVYTIEGNTGGTGNTKYERATSSKVMKRNRSTAFVLYIYRPKYTAMKHSNAWNLRVGAKKIVAYMKKHNFKYKKLWGDNSLSWSENGAKKKKTTNCSTMVSYALQKKGFIKKGEYFWINGDHITFKGGLTMAKLKKIATITHPHKSPKNAHLRKGDIVGYKNRAHTMIFAGFNKDGDPTWYSTGGAGDIKSGKAHVKKSYNKKRIDTIIRLK